MYKVTWQGGRCTLLGDFGNINIARKQEQSLLLGVQDMPISYAQGDVTQWPMSIVG